MMLFQMKTGMPETTRKIEINKVITEQKNYVEFEPGKFREALYNENAQWNKRGDAGGPPYSPLQVEGWVSRIREKSLGVTNQGKDDEKYYLKKQDYSDIMGGIRKEIGNKSYEQNYRQAFQAAGETIASLPKNVRSADGDW